MLPEANHLAFKDRSLPSKGHHLALLYHLVLLLADEDQLLSLQPIMNIQHQAHLWSTTMPRGAVISAWNQHPVHLLNLQEHLHLSEHLQEHCQHELGQNEAWRHGGCLVTFVPCVTACPPLGQCPHWGLFGVLVCTLGPYWCRLCVPGCPAV